MRIQLEHIFMNFNCPTSMDVGDATSTTSMDVVKVGLKKQVGLEFRMIEGCKMINFFEKQLKKRGMQLIFYNISQKSLLMEDNHS